MKAARDRLAKATVKWLIHKDIPSTAIDSPISKLFLILLLKLHANTFNKLFGVLGHCVRLCVVC